MNILYKENLLVLLIYCCRSLVLSLSVSAVTCGAISIRLRLTGNGSFTAMTKDITTHPAATAATSKPLTIAEQLAADKVLARNVYAVVARGMDGFFWSQIVLLVCPTLAPKTDGQHKLAVDRAAAVVRGVHPNRKAHYAAALNEYREDVALHIIGLIRTEVAYVLANLQAPKTASGKTARPKLDPYAIA